MAEAALKAAAKAMKAKFDEYRAKIVTTEAIYAALLDPNHDYTSPFMLSERRLLENYVRVQKSRQSEQDCANVRFSQPQSVTTTANANVTILRPVSLGLAMSYTSASFQGVLKDTTGLSEIYILFREVPISTL